MGVDMAQGPSQEGIVFQFPPEKVDTMSMDSLHSMAHAIADAKNIPFNCVGFNKDSLIEWIKKNGDFQVAEKGLN